VDDEDMDMKDVRRPNSRNANAADRSTQELIVNKNKNKSLLNPPTAA